MNGFIVEPGRVVVGAAWPDITDTDSSGRLAGQSAKGFLGLFWRAQRHWAAMSPADKIVMSGSFALTSISSSI